MQKQEKKLEVKKVYNKVYNSNKVYTKKHRKVKSNKFKFFKAKKNNLKNLLRVKKFLKSKPYKENFQRFFSPKKLKKFNRYLTIKVTSNNVFCTLVNRSLNKTLCLGTSGKYKIKTSRKRLRHTAKLILSSFFNDIKSKIISTNLIIKLTAPVKIRKQILLFLSENLRKQNLIIKVNEKKCFNGCRPAKKRRKKRKGLRIFK